MPGCFACGFSEGVQPSFIASAWRWTDSQLAVGAVAVLLSVLLICLHLRTRLTGGTLAALDVSVQPGSSSSRALALQRGPGKTKPPADSRGGGIMAQQLAVSLQSLLGDAAAKQLLQDVATAQAHQAATNTPPPLTYQGVSQLVPVSVKVDAPHEKLHSLGPTLLRELCSTLDAAAAGATATAEPLDGAAATEPLDAAAAAAAEPQAATPAAMFVGAAAVFRGCIQLLGAVFEILQPQAGAAEAAAGGSPGAGEQRAEPAAQVLGCPHQAHQLLEGVFEALQAQGSGGDEAAACVQGHMAAVQGSGGSSVRSSHQAGVPGVTLVCLDPPCAAEGAAGALDIHLHPVRSSSSSSSTGRLVLYSDEGLHVDVPSVPLGDTIRLDLPALAAGVYHVALLPTLSIGGVTSTDTLAAACQPLATHPLLVLPPAAATELHHYWRCAISAAAVQGVAHSPEQQGALGRGPGGLPAPLAALQHVWSSQLSAMICDIAAVMLSAAAAPGGEHPHQQQQQQQPGSMGASLGPGTFQPAALTHLLQHLLAHLCKQQLWELVAVIAQAGAEVVAGATGGSPSSLLQPAAATRGVEEEEGVTGSNEHKADGACSPSMAAAAGGGGGGDASGLGASSSSKPVGLGDWAVPTTQGSSSGGSSTCGAAAASMGRTQQFGIVAEELAASATWAGTWRQLSAGFSNAGLEGRYLEYVYDTTLPADVAVVLVFIVVALGHGVWTDAYVTHTPMWHQVTARLLFVALFCVPAILLLVYRRRLRHGGRRERARRLVDAGLSLTGFVIVFGRLHALPTMSRMLSNTWRSWALTVVGQGAFTACCRQTRTRTWLPVAAYDYLGWCAASALVQGRLLPAVLRQLCVALAALVCSVGLELRSRRRFCKQQLLQAREGAAGAAGRAAAAAGKGKAGECDKCHTD